jgi:hypothetical protein
VVMSNKYEIEAVAKFLTADELVVKAIRKKFSNRASELIQAIESGESPECNGEDLLTFLLDLLHNDARLYKRYIARGSFGPYHIDIRGLGGVYFFHAPEFDLTGYYLSIDDAGSDITLDWNDSLTSYSGRSYREGFVNKTIVEAIKKSKADDSLKQAQLFLSMPEALQDVSAWQDLLALTPIQDIEICVTLLERWFGSTIDFSSVSGSTHNNLFRLTLTSCEAVFSYLMAHGRSALVQQIQVAADHDIETLTSKLKKTHGVARMGLVQSLGCAKERSKSINFALQELVSIEERALPKHRNI